MNLFGMEAADPKPGRSSRYEAPRDARSIDLAALIAEIGRPAIQAKQLDLLRGLTAGRARKALIYYVGKLELLQRPSVSIVGTREVSQEGWRRSQRLAKELAGAGVTIVSGL